MNVTERFEATCRFEAVDRPLFFPTIGFWRETVQRWHTEGLPRRVVNDIAAILYFDFETWVPIPVGTDKQPGFFPLFLPKTVRREGRFKIVRNTAGNLVKVFEDDASGIPHLVEPPVKTLDDFRKVKWRLRPGTPGRCTNPLYDALYAFAKLRRRPLGVMVSGLFAFHRHLMGLEPLMYAYAGDPDLLHAMSRQWVKLTWGVVRRLKKRYGIRFVSYWEDMCYKAGPLISPGTFREFMAPYYKIVVDDARENGVHIHMVDTDGDCTKLIPLFQEVGVNLLFPFEVQSGMDIRQVRKDHPELVIFGGLDKRVLARGREEIEEEFRLKVPPMLQQGGYIPAIDHCVPPDVPLDNFRFFMDLIKKYKA